MRAIICKEYGSPDRLVFGEFPCAPLGPNEIRLRVHAAGVNFPDTLIIQGKYQLTPPMPFVPGFEVAGKVIEIGQKVVRFKIGDRLMALTSSGYGGFAEEAVIDSERAVPIPHGMDYVTSAAIYTAYGTAYHALVQRGKLKEGETLLVVGASGGVGLAAVEIGKALGGKVIAVASTDEKLQIAKDHGADAVINYARENLKTRIKELTNGAGVDVCLDPVGGDAFDVMSRSMNWNGRLLVVGFASGRIPQLPINLVLLKGYQLVGVYWGSFVTHEPVCNYENFQHMFEMHAEGKLNPVVCQTYPLEQAAFALNDLLGRRVTGKVILTVP
ncbi:NADPH2:quinone reductase [Collimonas sp. OK607]|uniref:NADPH:quinone oxidoreductase family protein n=1 Tax=Collimonas sp. OK607 TaxID=1798194 RepID=UPI0008DFF7AE|nr:NADPH:quinone oxidoreductase family protein [Collimonas sp. OK607]SFB35543.1 NADPH2:quinone reductase [Collimonas sp. OK607]